MYWLFPHLYWGVFFFDKYAFKLCVMKWDKNYYFDFFFKLCVVFSFPLSGPASDHQFSVEENETSYSGKIHHHHRRHTHSQETLCHTHTKNSEYSQPEEEEVLSKQWLSANL